ncbi:GntR family transcriptional regulator [Kaistia sp. 32K]|uniref:FadR/GntR family transcriptional regulator n=1 Tax=Kaistia sp. 32K TaxID=2795690 RepID=UPI001914FA83|nr:FadR/GntR family transcriptional regulator [Kaistia sp. 32K]BCP55232.1 GntR family transcriptional regulator [Kaistia sp. 32K]
MTNKDDVVFGAIRQVPNLRSELADTLIAQIEAGVLKPGQRLPTEQAIVQATGVSRTIVREALATLRAKGLIATRQGLGAFVSTHPTPRSFTIPPDQLESIDEIQRVLELRMGIECEAASLAAMRRTPEDIETIQGSLDALDRAIDEGGYGAQEDYAFHRSILVATHNPYYSRLFDTFGSSMVPRQWARLDRMTATERKRHAARMRREHHAIFAAIRDGNETAARRAIRAHLARSAARFEEMREQLSTP